MTYSIGVRCSKGGATLRALLVTVGSVAAVIQPSAVAAEKLQFNRDIRPILSDRCFRCHGPDEGSRESGLRLDVREEAIAFGAITPGDLESSTLVERIETDDASLVMPPPESKMTLTDAERATLRAWLAQGADYEAHWSLQSLARQTKVPSSGDEWARSEIDRFVARRLSRAGLAPNDEADRAAWLRRVTFDLTGLPPTTDELDAFHNDSSSVAYERVVDRLLSSPAYAERMASEWLDVARYSDTYGYQRDDERFVWPYRDWVVEAFSRNLPYDEFATWQIAGDLLPGSTREQRLATAFCRLHSHKKEGGVAVEEFRVENVADRTHTFASAFLGLTMECARCHDHKYDPLSMADYYRLTAFFANVDERGLISFFTNATPTPAMPLPSPEQESALAEAEQALAEATAVYNDALIKAEARYGDWASRGGAGPSTIKGLVARVTFDAAGVGPSDDLTYNEASGFVSVDKNAVDSNAMLPFRNEADAEKPALSPAANRLAQGRSGKGLLLTGDDAVVVPGVGHVERHEAYSFSIWIKPSESTERSVLVRRSRGWDDAGSMGYALVKRGARLRANLVHYWPGNAIAVETSDVLCAGEWRHVAVTYDGSSRASGLKIYVDGVDSEAVVIRDGLTRTVSNWQGGYADLAIGARYRDRGFKDGVVDEFRVYDRELSAVEVRHDFDGQSLDRAFEDDEADPAHRRHRERLDLYRSVVDQQVASAREALQSARAEWGAAMDAMPSITVMRERSEPRAVYLLDRGQYDAPGEAVTAGTPEALPAFPEDLPRNRLGLARWLFHPDHPLTARVAVNRYWQMLFGAGLVRTPEDFGSQGSPPSHPELLDWLARDFVSTGWDVRRLVKMIVLSSTYRQSSVVDLDVRDADPDNRLLSRGPSKRLPAEMIRDNALSVSGLLVSQVGGPPVRPYDLPLAYSPVSADTGAALYRRSLYTFWKRTSPSPVMMTMNANRREVCLLQREVTSSPLQALVLLNGTQFIEASRVFAEKLLRQHGGDPPNFVDDAFRALTSRVPDPSERELLIALYRDQVEEFRAAPSQAEQLLSVGAAARDDGLSVDEHAAATVVVNAIMNLDESVRCR